MGINRLRSRYDLLIRGIQFSVAYVVFNRARKEEIILCHNAHLPSQTLDRDFLYDVRAAFASADISNANYAQNEYQSAQKDGRTPLRGTKDLYLPAGVLAIRMQFNPIAFGSRYVVMRLLYDNPSEGIKSGQEFGEYEQRLLMHLRSFPTGLVVVAGPTSSGKSTTLVRNMSLMLKERRYEINLITVEDPAEQKIFGAHQMPVTNASNEEQREEKFTEALAAALRSDPDTLMVGEIRTLAAAQLTVKGALSGHNVWTTQIGRAHV